MSEGAAKKEDKPRKFQAIRGTRDVLPPETALWNRVEQAAHEVFATYGYGEIRLPIFEQTELFARAVGGETDIVSKEMYTFHDRPAGMPTIEEIAADFAGYARKLVSFFKRGEIPQTSSNKWAIDLLERKLSEFDTMGEQIRIKVESGLPINSDREKRRELFSELGSFTNSIVLGDSISLRPEATASVCRAYIEHGMQSLPQPVKLYCMGPMFRRERPQKGRYRQFYQIDAEVLGGTDAPAIDAEVIEMVMTFFERVGLEGVQLHINSIGDKNCRPKYVELLRAELLKVKDKLGPDSQRRIETNPLRVLDSKVKEEQSVIEKLPHITNHLCKDCAEHYAAVKRELHLRGVKCHENWRLVRGLDYYMRTTFEITAPGLGSQDAVCGGGRYDGLVELLGGPPTKGIGFAIGEDRLVLSLQERIAETFTNLDEALPSFSTVMQRPDVAVAGTSKETWDQAVQLATSFRKRGLSVFLPKSGTKIQRVFDAASRLGIRVAILVGEDELKHNNYVVRILSPLEPDRQRDFSVSTGDALMYGKLVKLRQDLERALLRLATGKPDLRARHNLTQLLERLVHRELVPIKTAAEVRDLIPMLNRAIHGEPLAADSIQWALAVGNLLLNELEKLSPMEV